MFGTRSASAATAAAFLFACLATTPARAAAGAPDVLATIKPVHALVAGVMRGVGEPKLLLEGAASPHTYSLRPSDARLLADADVVFWIGEGYETFMIRPLGTLAEHARIVALSKEAGLLLLPTREGGVWEAHTDEHERHAHGGLDMHVWLDPENGKRIVDKVAAVLSERDPAHRAVYSANAAQVSARLDALEAELHQALSPVKAIPYVVFHDAYRYFEHHFGTTAVGSIAVSTGRAPGARRLYDIRAKVLQLHARCVFSEPQFEPALVRTVIEGTGARTGVLDPLGATIPAGPDAYFAVMRGLAESLAGCLSR